MANDKLKLEKILLQSFITSAPRGGNPTQAGAPITNPTGTEIAVVTLHDYHCAPPIYTGAGYCHTGFKDDDCVTEIGQDYYLCLQSDGNYPTHRIVCPTIQLWCDPDQDTTPEKCPTQFDTCFTFIYTCPLGTHVYNCNIITYHEDCFSDNDINCGNPTEAQYDYCWSQNPTACDNNETVINTNPKIPYSNCDFRVGE